MKNKEVIDKLTEYFKKNSDFPTVARSLAACLVDFRRIANIKSLPEEERKRLMARVKANSAQLDDFIINGCNKRHRIKICNTAEEARFG